MRPAPCKIKIFEILIIVSDVLLQAPQVSVPGATLDGVDIMATKDVDGRKGAPCRVARNHLPLRDILDGQLACYPVLDPDDVVEADVLHQDMESIVIVPDTSLVGGLEMILIQDPVCGLRLDGVSADVDFSEVAGLLLDNPEDVPVKA